MPWNQTTVMTELFKFFYFPYIDSIENTFNDL